jgi:hypothetical protein
MPLDSRYSAKVEIIAADGTRRATFGKFDSFTSRCLALIAEEPIAASLAISVEHEDVLFVGEVVACQLESTGYFRIQIYVRHTLSSLQSLMKLNAELMAAQQLSADHKLEYVQVRM